MPALIALLPFIFYLILLGGCTSVRENPPQLTTDTTGSELTNRSCLFFCYVTGTFTGSPGRAANTGSARSTDSSNFTPSTEASHSLTLPGRRTAPKPIKPLKPLPKGSP